MTYLSATGFQTQSVEDRLRAWDTLDALHRLGFLMDLFHLGLTHAQVEAYDNLFAHMYGTT